MVMLAASKGAKGLRRFMTLGKDMLSQAPAATGASTTCMRVTQRVFLRVAMHIHAGRQQGCKEASALSLLSGCKMISHRYSSQASFTEGEASARLPKDGIPEQEQAA